MCGAYRTVVAPLITSYRHRYRSILTRPVVGSEPANNHISGLTKWLYCNLFSELWPQTPHRRCVVCADNESPHPTTRLDTVGGASRH